MKIHHVYYFDDKAILDKSEEDLKTRYLNKFSNTDKIYSIEMNKNETKSMLVA